MAVILAVDPGGSQALAIERLTSELHEHELVSAESCAEAIAVVETACARSRAPAGRCCQRQRRQS